MYQNNKIIFLINSLTSGGAEKVLITILTKLMEDRNNIELICLEKNNFYNLPVNLKVSYLSDSDGSISGIKKLLLIPYFAYRLKKYVKINKINIVHSHLYRANYINVLSQVFGSNHKSHIVNHGIISRYKVKGLLGKINLLLINKLYSRANIVILISKLMKQDLNYMYKFNNKQLVIHNPYDVDNIIKLKDEIVDNFIFEKNKKYLITMGRLISLKRYQDVILALDELDSNIELILLGDGEEKTNLLNLSESLNIEKRVHFLGNVLNPFKYLSKAHIFILSSETEGFPNSIIESLACNTPVISSDCISGPREILAPGTEVNIQLKEDIETTEYGILYPVGNIDLLVKSIKMLITTGNNVNTIARAKDFSINKIIHQYKKVLELE